MATPTLPAFSGPPEITNLINYLNTLTQQNIPRLLAQPQAFMAPNLYNFSSQNLRNFRKAIANVRRGVQNAKVAMIGDSTTRGTGSATTTGQALNGWGPQLAAALTQAGLTTGWQNVFGNPSTNYDSRLSLGSAAVSNVTVGGGCFGISGAGTLGFTTTQNCDTFDIYYIDGAGVFTLNLDGGATLATVTGASAFTIKKQTVPGSLGAHTLNCVWVSGTCFIVGIDCYNSAAKQVTLWNMGWSGSKSTDWATNAAGRDPLNCIPATFLPDLGFICLGINDWLNATPVATYSAAIAALIAAVRQSGDVILMTPVPTQISTKALSAQQPFIDALYALAAATSCPLIDLWGRFGTQEANSTLYFDDRHPNGVGYNDVTALLTAALRGII